ncbi:hypothetical protein HPG69_014975 [Diceros bicornis minor]|uniref:Uncharacterized protein n=1 Tax=Diceros bicornis minor TaxID=77932 RepID=A0A7J7FJY7_DICBM|nr:hypothetical protein HPG69_014975 [Diceros bicornis minor]
MIFHRPGPRKRNLCTPALCYSPSLTEPGGPSLSVCASFKEIKNTFFLSFEKKILCFFCFFQYIPQRDMVAGAAS